MPASPKGKGKLSKAEKDKQKKEEETQRLKEEEEARLVSEADEKARKEKEQGEAEEKQRLLNEERNRRSGQLQELSDIWHSNRNTLFTEQSLARANAKWARYMRCDGSPDPTVAGEINTYMNLWRENVKSNDIDSVLKESDLTLSLIDELENILDITPAEETSDQQVDNYKQTVTELQHLLQEKLDYASHDLLLKASRFADAETSNLQKVVNNDVITLCMWGNLSKNPRVRSFEFEEKGITFDIPRLLALSDCAFRVLFTKYDHLSPQCRTYVPRKKIKSECTGEEETGTLSARNQDEEGKEGASTAAEGEEEQAPPEPERETTEDMLASLRNDGEKEEVESKQEDAEQEEEHKDEHEIKTPEPEEWEDFDGDDDVVDLRAYQVLGGIFHFNLLHLPPQPKQVNDWVITQIIEPAQLNHMEYQADMMSTAPSSAKESTREEAKKKKVPTATLR